MINRKLTCSVDSGAADLSLEASPDDKIAAAAQQATLERRKKIEARILQNSNSGNLVTMDPSEMNNQLQLSSTTYSSAGADVLNVSVPSRDRTMNDDTADWNTLEAGRLKLG